MTKYKIPSKCHQNYICRESHYFRLKPEKPKKNVPCQIDEIYITLGEKFINSDSPSLYRLSFRISSLDCLSKLKIKISEVSLESGDLKAFQQEESLYEEEQRLNVAKRDFYVRHYQFKGSVNGQFYEMDKLYVFTEFTQEQLPDPGFFAYKFQIEDSIIKGPFTFESKIFDYLEGTTENLEIISFGDHDAQEQGGITINALNVEDSVDLYLLLGDYAYEIYDDNGEKGREYFLEMEPILARQPILFIAGNHEWFDEYALFYSKMTFPGDPYLGKQFLFEGEQKDYSFGPDLIRKNLGIDLKERNSHHSYFVKIRDIFILSVNMDILLSQTVFFPKYIMRMHKILGHFSEFNHKIFTSHRPLYCSQVDLFSKDCIANSYVLSPLTDILNFHNFNLIVMAHIHHYERLIPLENFLPKYRQLPSKSIFKQASQNMFKSSPIVPSTTVISGSAGCAHAFINFPAKDIEFLMFMKQKTPGFSSFSFYKENRNPFVLVRYISSSTHQSKIPVLLRAGVPSVFEFHTPLDSVRVRGALQFKRDSSGTLIYFFLLGFVILAIVLVYFSQRKFKSSGKKRRIVKSKYSSMKMNFPDSIMEEKKHSLSESDQTESTSNIQSESNLIPK